MYDCLIVDGKIIDGNGVEPVAGDVGLNGSRITATGDLRGLPAACTINAAGCYVCPGFIDAHSHSDAFLLAEPTALSKVFQGITTEIIGNCGASAAPIRSKSDLPFDWQFLSYPGQWGSMGEYLKLLDECRPVVNVVPIVGHNRLRIAVMGHENRHASTDELQKMKRLLEQSMEEGGWGMSTGLIYRPGKYASRNEITELVEIVARRKGIYTTHMRSEAALVRESVAETIRLGRETGVRIQISHLKTAGASNWRFVDEVLSLISNARAQGLELTADRYPYIFSCTDLDVLLPDWLVANERMVILRKLGEKETQTKLRDELAAGRLPSYWDGIIVATSTQTEWRGRTIRSIAETLAVEPAEAVIRILATDELLTQAFYAGMCDENMWKIYAQPFVMVGSDSSLRVPPGLFPNDHPHPRAYGTFPKFLRAALDGKTVPLGEAVRKMTSLAADQFKIKDRGRLTAGSLADIVIFNPATVKDLSTYETPHQLSTGIRDVIVNGKPVIAEGRLTGNRPGRVLSPKQ